MADGNRIVHAAGGAKVGRRDLQRANRQTASAIVTLWVQWPRWTDSVGCVCGGVVEADAVVVVAVELELQCANRQTASAIVTLWVQWPRWTDSVWMRCPARETKGERQQDGQQVQL